MITAVRSAHPFAHVAAGPAPSAPTRYRLFDLGTHLDGAPLLPVALNDDGDICVEAASRYPSGIVRGFCLSGAHRIPVGVAFGLSPVAALGSGGLVAGATGTAPRAVRAWASHIGSFGERLWPDSASQARGINASGQIVGNVSLEVGETTLSRAFFVSPQSPARMLTPPQGGTTVATALNDLGDVALNSSSLGAPAGETHAWLFRDGAYFAIPGLGGDRAWATAVTPEGRVAGHSRSGDGATHGFLWEDGVTSDLGTLPGCDTEMLAANDHRVTVGRALEPLHGPRAVRWSPDLGLVLLSDLVVERTGWHLQEALGLNRRGEIIGRGLCDGQPRGFLLRPDFAP